MALLQVGEFLLHPFYSSGKVVNVHHHAQHVSLPVPCAFRLPPGVQLLQFVVSLVIVPFHLVAELGKHVVVAVQLHVQPP